VVNAFPPDTLYLTIPEAEATFLRQNLLLYAEKFRIEAARALVLQARLWPNPTFSVEQIDLFAPYNAEFRPLSTFPRFYQVAANFSQTLLTAGKRLHNIALQKAALHIQEAAFADLLRNLRYDLHITLRALQRDQIALSTLARQETLLTDLVSRYEVLARSQLVPEVEYLRLQSLLQSLRATRQQQQLTYEENQNRLRQLLNLPIRDRTVWIDTMGFWPPADTTMPRLDSLLSLAASRPDVRLSAYQLAYDEANLRLQKAYAYPDVALMANYDRLGSYRIESAWFRDRPDPPPLEPQPGPDTSRSRPQAGLHYPLRKRPLYRPVRDPLRLAQPHPPQTPMVPSRPYPPRHLPGCRNPLPPRPAKPTRRLPRLCRLLPELPGACAQSY
jgi:cobalt-zinc-cadmium efflux system outer membrane protein